MVIFSCVGIPILNSFCFEQVRSLRMSGSCALNLCGIACGRLDIFCELGFGGPWYGFLLCQVIVVVAGK